MRRSEDLAFEYFKTIFEDPWYGLSVKGILESITTEKSKVKITPGTHSIEEILLHMLAWTKEVNCRLLGSISKEPDMGDWPPASDYKNLKWKKLIEGYLDQSEIVFNTIKNFSDIKLDKTVGAERNPNLGTGLSYQSRITGLIQHNVYHSAQISILNKMIEKSISPV